MWFQPYVISITGKFVETERRLEVVRVWHRVEWGVIPNGYRVSWRGPGAVM